MLEWATAQGVPLWDAVEEPEKTGLKAAAVRKLRAFGELIRELQRELSERPLVEAVTLVLEATGYREGLAADDDDEAHARLENLQELHGNLLEFVSEHPDATLDEFLETVLLVGAERGNGRGDTSVTMMTVHSAKGLEFDRVYVAGCEERIFPHVRVMDDPLQLEEERRLAYVAITRAKRLLTLTTVAQRQLFGQIQLGTPSRFLRDLPRESVALISGSGRPRASVQHRGRAHISPSPSDGWRDDIVYDDEHRDDAFEEFGAARQDVDDAALDPVLDSSEIDAEQPWVDASDEADAGVSLYVGMVVRHANFGVGEVMGWSGVGERTKVTVRWSNRQVKTIMAKFLAPA